MTVNLKTIADGTNGTNSTFTLGSVFSVTAGALAGNITLVLWVEAACNSSLTFAVTDTTGLVWNQRYVYDNVDADGVHNILTCFYAAAGASYSGTPTITNIGASQPNSQAVALAAFTGPNPNSPFTTIAPFVAMNPANSGSTTPSVNCFAVSGGVDVATPISYSLSVQTTRLSGSDLSPPTATGGTVPPTTTETGVELIFSNQEPAVGQLRSNILLCTAPATDSAQWAAAVVTMGFAANRNMIVVDGLLDVPPPGVTVAQGHCVC